MSIWFDNTNKFIISASDLIEENSGLKIKAIDILFNKNSSLLLPNNTLEIPETVVISLKHDNQSVSHDQGGLYYGHFFVDFIEGNGNYSIPITVDIKPTFDQIIIWVVNGIAISIAFWKSIRFVNARYEHTDDTRSVRQDLTKQPRDFRKFVEYKQITHGTILKNAALDAGSIIFGIVIGMVALLNNDFITGVHNLDLPTKTVLIGIGLGIGSLKEYVFQASEPNKTSGS